MKRFEKNLVSFVEVMASPPFPPPYFIFYKNRGGGGGLVVVKKYTGNSLFFVEKIE